MSLLDKYFQVSSCLNFFRLTLFSPDKTLDSIQNFVFNIAIVLEIVAYFGTFFLL